MGRALSVSATAGDRNLAAVRRWWRLRHPPPSIAKRLYLLYTTALASVVVGALAYGTASSALAQLVTPDWLARFGPALAALAILAAAHWGAYQGPVVFSVPD